MFTGNWLDLFLVKYPRLLETASQTFQYIVDHHLRLLEASALGSCGKSPLHNEAVTPAPHNLELSRSVQLDLTNSEMTPRA